MISSSTFQQFDRLLNSWQSSFELHRKRTYLQMRWLAKDTRNLSPRREGRSELVMTTVSGPILCSRSITWTHTHTHTTHTVRGLDRVPITCEQKSALFQFSKVSKNTDNSLQMVYKKGCNNTTNKIIINITVIIILVDKIIIIIMILNCLVLCSVTHICVVFEVCV